MIAFIPVSSYRVDYQIGSGRPYSDFERLLLEAIASGETSLDALHTSFGVHRRMIIEGLVTLMQAGWLALGDGSDEFVTTHSGKVALTGDTLPPSIALANRTTTVVMERVSGQLVRSSDVRLYPGTMLSRFEGRAAVIPKRAIPNVVAEGMVVPLLTHRPGEFIRSVGPVSRRRDSADYLVVAVETHEDPVRVAGMPKTWEPLLLDVLELAVKKRMLQLSQQGLQYEEDEDLLALVQEVRRVPPESEVAESNAWITEILESDVLVTATEREEALRDSLKNARTYIGILSSDLDVNTVQKLTPLISSAIERGVVIDIMVATSPAEAKTDVTPVIRLIQDLANKTGNPGVSGRLAVTARRLPSNARLLCADPDGRFQCVVGSHDWLGPEMQDRVSLALRIRHPRAVARLCQLLADHLHRDPQMRTSVGPVILTNAAGRLNAESLDFPGGRSKATARIRLLLDRQHEAEMRRALSKASDRVVITSRTAHPESPGLAALASALHARGVEADIIVGNRSSHLPALDALLERLGKYGADIRASDGLQANLLAIDGSYAAVSSFNWLSGYEDHRLPYGTEVGVALQGSGVAEMVWSKLAEVIGSQA